MNILDRLNELGWTTIHKFLEGDSLRELIRQCEPALDCTIGIRPGQRNILSRCANVRRFAESEFVLELIRPIIGFNARPVRAILFDKSPEANWKVPWHQDQNIAVNRKLNIPGFGPWTIKDGVQHVIPPREILEGMITARFHLDDCGIENGCLRVIPGSHKLGKLATSELVELAKENPFENCEMKAGDVLLMRPLIAHASSEAGSPTRRRILHVEYTSTELPGDLDWEIC